MLYSLVILLLVLLLDRLIPDRGGLSPFSWFSYWLDSVEQRFNGGEYRHGVAALGLTVGSVFIAVLVIQSLLAAMNGLLRAGFDVLILYFLVQIGGKLAIARKVADAAGNDDVSAAEAALADLPVLPGEPVSEASPAWIGTARLLSGANSLFLAPVFWYLLLGPAGAILNVAAGTASRDWDWQKPRFHEFGRGAYYLHQGLNWLPVRIVAIGYALVGDFENVLQGWRQQRDTWAGDSEQLLTDVGMAALRHETGDMGADAALLQRAIALQNRATAFWVAVVLALSLVCSFS